MGSMTCPSSCSVALRYLIRWHGGLSTDFSPCAKKVGILQPQCFLQKRKKMLFEKCVNILYYISSVVIFVNVKTLLYGKQIIHNNLLLNYAGMFTVCYAIGCYHSQVNGLFGCQRFL